MIHPLPAETVLEAKHKARRDTRLLFGVLLGIYIVCFNVVAVVSCLFLATLTGIFVLPGFVKAMLYLDENGLSLESFLWFHLAASVAGLLFAFLHFHAARKRPLYKILRQLGARPADRGDDYHSRFINIVHEAEAATGIYPIRPVIVPTTGYNAFSVQDGKNHAAIGATEGSLARLDRSELTAVVAHEAAHLVHEDSKLATTACALSAVFDRLRARLSAAGERYVEDASSQRRTGGKQSAPVFELFLWCVTALGHGMASLLCMAISRKREFMADAHAVEMCKDPLSLAEALYKISEGYRGSFNVAQEFAPLFILNLKSRSLDERGNFVANLMSTHPPMKERLAKLMAWAKADLRELEKRSERAVTEEEVVKREAAPKFLVRHGGAWNGPFVPVELMSMGLVTPSTWVCQEGESEFTRAVENPFFLSFFEKEIPAPGAKRRCPRCRVSLVGVRYEGAPVLYCGYCQGYLLNRGVLERIIARQEKEFSADEIERAQVWRRSRRGRLSDLCEFPAIKCPLCDAPMDKAIHSSLTTVVIDQCSNRGCRASWCDGGELEKIQVLVEAACPAS